MAFHEAFDLLVRDYRKNKKYLEDKRLTYAERLILQAHMLIRNNKHDEVFELLEQCTPSNDYFNAHKNFILGVASINAGEDLKALDLLEQAEEHFNSEYDHYYLFLLYLNCYTCGLNLSDKAVAQKYFDKLSQLGAKTDRQEVLLRETEFDHAILMADTAKALKLKEKLDQDKVSMSPSDLPHYIINCFHLGMQLENFTLAINAMNELKVLKKFHRSENYKFMHSLISYLLEDAPIYLREEDLSNVAILNYQVQCIKLLSQGDAVGAYAYWQKLQELNPHIYQGEFDFQGNKCLFSLCLKKSLRQTKQQRIQVPQDLTMFEKLDFIFENSNGVISKEELFQLLWNKELYDKADLQKLSRLIYKYRKSANFEIKTHHGSYKVQPKKAA